MSIDPRHISIEDYSYDLPENKIAFHPLAERDASKLLIYHEGKIDEDIFRNITNHLPGGSLLVFNDTKVVEARILFQKPSGGIIEIFCLEPGDEYADLTTAFSQQQQVRWHCLVGGASKWKRGQVLVKNIQEGNNNIELSARFIEKRKETFIIELSWTPVTLSFAEVLHITGAIPLPPYIKRAADPGDTERYQTVYAQSEGSVAAPTAGLHFTGKIFRDLKQKNIQTDFVTLHVGAGTFKPVKSATMAEHDMHAEWIDVDKSLIQNILNHLDNKIIAVGTTSLRTIESLYWFGVQMHDHADVETHHYASLRQWEPYDLEKRNIPVKIALEYLLQWLDDRELNRFIAKTQILISPGYEFKIVKGLITNFHQPKSTLLLLVAAFIGEDLPTGQAGWRKLYDYALANDFRFLSYGDGCLLLRNA